MKTPTNFTLRRSSVEDAPLFYSVIDRTMRKFILKTVTEATPDFLYMEKMS